MKLYDFTCPKCGHTEIDVAVSEDTIELCSMCGEEMVRQFPACTIKTPPRHHHSLKGYKPGRGDVRFGKVKDL